MCHCHQAPDWERVSFAIDAWHPRGRPSHHHHHNRDQCNGDAKECGACGRRNLGQLPQLMRSPSNIVATRSVAARSGRPAEQNNTGLLKRCNSFQGAQTASLLRACLFGRRVSPSSFKFQTGARRARWAIQVRNLDLPFVLVHVTSSGPTTTVQSSIYPRRCGLGFGALPPPPPLSRQETDRSLCIGAVRGGPCRARITFASASDSLGPSTPC
jgi:hypothetical protein